MGNRPSNPFGPRPSAAKEAAAASEPALSEEARRFAAEPPVLFKMKLRRESRRALKKAARARGVTMKLMLLRLCVADGVEGISPDDLKVQHGEDDDE